MKRSDCQIGENAQISDIMSSNTNKGVLKETGWSDCTRLLFDLNAKWVDLLLLQVYCPYDELRHQT